MSKLEGELYWQLSLLDVQPPEREYRLFALEVGAGKGLRDRLLRKGYRDFRFDMAWTDIKLLVEVNGGAWVGGRHGTGKGFTDDMQKKHDAMSLGWNIYECGPELIKSGQASRLIEELVLRGKAK